MDITMGLLFGALSSICSLCYNCIYYFKILVINSMIHNKQSMIEGIALVDIDPSLTINSSEQQKWLTSIQIVSQPMREKKNSKIVNITPGIYILLVFCQNNRDPIFQIQFMTKVQSDWVTVKGTELIYNILGSHLCFKTTQNQNYGPICDIDLLSIQRKCRFGENKDIINVPHGYKIVSHQMPLGYLIFRRVKGIIEQTFKPTLAEKYCSNQNTQVNFSQLPMFCFPNGIKLVKEIRGFATFNFMFTLENAERIYITCLIFKENLQTTIKEKLGLMPDQNIFYEKALCITSKYCYTDQFAECLQHLYRLSMSKSQIPFYRIIQTLVDSMNYPLQDSIGKQGVRYTYSGNTIDFPTASKYPIVSERALYTIFKFLSVDNIINVFEALLLQKKILFVSQSKTILGFAVEAFINFLFPFKWEQVLIPILPTNLKDYLTAPVPLIAGISPSLVDSSIEDDSIIVFLDKNQVLNDEDLPPLPQKLFKQLRKRLEKMEVYDQVEVNQYLENPQSTYLFKMQEVSDPHFKSHLIRDIFFEFILILMKNYRKYLNKKKLTNAQMSMSGLDEGPTCFTDYFKVQAFLSDLGMTKVGSFGYKFTQSSIFTRFIEKAFRESNDPEIQFFDDCIERKKAKKQIIFINPITNDDYVQVQNPKVDLENKGPFFYDKFPSLSQEVIQEQQITIEIIEDDPKQIQADLKSLIENQFNMNSNLYESVEQDQEGGDFQIMISKMFNLLLNSNKQQFEQFLKKLQVPQSEKHLQIYQHFLSIYTKQSNQIDIIMEEWPNIVSEQEIEQMTKIEYIKRRKQFSYSKILQNNDSKKIYMVKENNDIQTLIRESTKITFICSGQLIQSTRIEGIIIQVKSHCLKRFIDYVLGKQAGFFIDYIQKQNFLDLKKSTFKKTSYQVWSMQNVLKFRDQIHYEKEFGTGVSNN